MTASKQTSKTASVSALALTLSLACASLCSMNPGPALAKNDLPANTAEVYRHHALELLTQPTLDPKGFDFYEKAIDLACKDYGPKSSYVGDLYFELACAEREAGKFTLAEQHFETALKIKPNSVNARLQLAALYKKENKTKELYDQIQAIKSKDPESTQAQQALLTLYSQEKKRPDQAAQAALVVHQMRTAKAQAIASAKSNGWLNPFAIVAPPTHQPASEQPATAMVNLKTAQPSLPIVTPTETQARTTTNENPTALNKENSISPLGVFSKMLAPHVKSADKVDAAQKAKREQEQSAERERIRLRLERERQREDLARRQAVQAPRGATRRGAAGSIAVARPIEAKSPGPALKTSARKIKAAEGKAAVEAKPLEAKPAEATAPETKTPAEAPVKEAPTKEAPQQAAVPTPTETAAPPPKKRSNAFGKVGILNKMPGEQEKPSDTNSENQPKSKPSKTGSNLQQLMPQMPMQQMPMQQMPPQEAPPPMRQSKPKHNGLVPPPPPTMALPGYNPYAPYGGGFMQPPPMINPGMMNGAPQAMPLRPKPKPAVKKEEPPPEEEDKSASTSASSKDTDENFLIDWGGAKQKKKMKPSQ